MSLDKAIASGKEHRKPYYIMDQKRLIAHAEITALVRGVNGTGGSK